MTTYNKSWQSEVKEQIYGSYKENRDWWSDGGVPCQRSRTAPVPHQVRSGYLQGSAISWKSVDDGNEESSSLDLFSLEMFENIAFIMAKHAHPDQVPDTSDEWLENFNTFSIYQILPQLIELWGLNVQTEVEARKASQKWACNDHPTLYAALCAARYQHSRPRPADHGVGQWYIHRAAERWVSVSGVGIAGWLWPFLTKLSCSYWLRNLHESLWG